MKHEVPQFIDVKDKVIGPFTFDQFLYLLGGGALAYLSFRFIVQPFGFLVAAALVGLAAMLAFYKVNNRPFIDFLASLVSYYTRDRSYSWKKQEQKQEQKKMELSTPVSSNPQTRYDITTVAQGLDVLDRSHEYEHRNTTVY